MLTFETVNELTHKVTSTGNDTIFTKAGAFIAGDCGGNTNYRFEKVLLGQQKRLHRQRPRQQRKLRYRQRPPHQRKPRRRRKPWKQRKLRNRQQMNRTIKRMFRPQDRVQQQRRMQEALSLLSGFWQLQYLQQSELSFTIIRNVKNEDPISSHKWKLDFLLIRRS